MKKYTLYIFAFFYFVSSISALELFTPPHEVSSRSFMFTRPGYYHLSMHEHLWHNIIYNKKSKQLAAFQIYSFFQRSLEKSKISRFFLINRNNELLVSGDANTDDAEILDVRAEWLNLSENFRGKLSVNPRQQQFGFVIEYNQDLKKLFDSWFFRDSYISIQIPFVAVDNDLRLRQSDITNPGKSIALPRDIIEAFKQDAWKFSRVEGERTRVDIAEIKIMLGRSFYSKNDFQITYYTHFIIPTGNRQDAKFLFDPVVGNNRHVGLGGATLFQIRLNRDPSKFSFCFFFNLEGTLLIRNTQFRTYDLRENLSENIKKPWSRFMLYNKKGATPNDKIPGVNLLTLETTVWPFNMIDFSAGWRFKTERIELELGYNIWGHGDERLRLSRPLQETFGIAGKEPGKTASKSTIDKREVDDKEFVAITEFDIDLESAKSPSALNHKVHAAGGIKNIGKRMDGFIGAGWFVDIPQKNSALKLWGVWVKLGTTF